jgi:FdhE protein
VAEVQRELSQLARERLSLAGPAALLADLLPVVWTGETIQPPSLTPEQAPLKLAGGVPLLRGESVALDGKLLRRRWADLCGVLQRHQNASAVELAGAVRSGSLNLEEMTAALIAGRADEVHRRADALNLDAGLAATLLRLTLFPLLVSLDAALAPLRSGVVWERGYCPTCGSAPLLGEFRGLEQTRWLRCGWCAAEWEFPRLACPFCGNREHQQLGHIHVEGEENRYRAATCDACRGYVKMLATLDVLPPLRLLVADLATIHLDLAAAERGYLSDPGEGERGVSTPR